MHRQQRQPDRSVGKYPRRGTRLATSSGSGTRPGSRARASRCCAGTRTWWPRWPTRSTSSTGTPPALSPGPRTTTPPTSRSRQFWTPSRRRPGRDWSSTDTPGTAVLHRERGGGAHVHVLAARCDLETGRSLNIAPPGWRKTFDPLRDAFNHEHGWSRPDDPARARVQQPEHRAYVEAARLRAGLRLESSPRDLIRDYLLQRVEHGTVRNRADVVSALREAGLEVPRQGKDYLTALDPETGDRWRLKGELYGENFERERFDRAVAETAGVRAQGDRGVDRERARAARRELAARREERAAYNRARYGGGDRADARAAAQGVAPALDRRPGSLARHLRRKLGDDAVLVEASRTGSRPSRRRTCGSRARARCWPRSRRRPGVWGCGRSAGSST